MSILSGLLAHAGHEVNAFWVVLSHFGHGLEYVLGGAILLVGAAWWNARRRRASK